LKNLHMFVCLSLLTGIMTKPGIAKQYATLGLNTWFERMVPVLLPIMILSEWMDKTGVTDRIAKCLYRGMGRFLHLSGITCYCIISGLLFGFPMGAKIISRFYQNKCLDRKEARWLLSFTNQLSPAYLTGVLLPFMSLQQEGLVLFVIYGITIIYGMILHLFYFRKSAFSIPSKQGIFDEVMYVSNVQSLRLPNCENGNASLFEATVKNSVQCILRLGAYMIFFSVFAVLPVLVFKKPCPVIHMLFEITTGLKLMDGYSPLLILFLTLFGGLSCLAQVHSILSETDLIQSIGEYAMHKLILSAICTLGLSFII